MRFLFLSLLVESIPLLYTPSFSPSPLLLLFKGKVVILCVCVSVLEEGSWVGETEHNLLRLG